MSKISNGGVERGVDFGFCRGRPMCLPKNKYANKY